MRLDTDKHDHVCVSDLLTRDQKTLDQMTLIDLVFYIKYPTQIQMVI